MNLSDVLVYSGKLSSLLLQLLWRVSFKDKMNLSVIYEVKLLYLFRDRVGRNKVIYLM